MDEETVRTSGHYGIIFRVDHANKGVMTEGSSHG